MSVVHVSEEELHDKIGKCIAGERLLIEQNGNRFSARIQHATTADVKVIPDTEIKNSHTSSGDVEGMTVAYKDILELEVKGVVYSRLLD